MMVQRSPFHGGAYFSSLSCLMQAICSTVYSRLFQQSEEGKWFLYGESPVTGLCNQISAVYTFLPVALLLNLNLILAPLYSRSSFEITMREFDYHSGGKIVLPFCEMFDNSSFLSLSSQFGVKTVDNNTTLHDCIISSDPWNSQYLHAVQRTRWRSSTNEQILDMVNNSGLNERRAIQPHGVIRIKSISKMLGYYNFNSSLELLHKVHHAIKPSSIIQRTINHFQQSLSSAYWTIHIRAEPDVFLRGKGKSTAKSKTALMDKLKQDAALQILIQRFNTTSWDCLLSGFNDVRTLDGSFYSQLPKIISYVLTSDCYQQWQATKSSFPPQVYVASGLYTRENVKRPVSINLADGNGHNELTDRGAVILALLQRIDLTKLSTKATLYRKTDADLTINPPLATLYPEQEAYVDLQLARYSTCFIPAHIPSTFSYMAGRMKELDQGQILQKPRMKKSLNNVYSQFIF